MCECMCSVRLAPRRGLPTPVLTAVGLPALSLGPRLPTLPTTLPARPWEVRTFVDAWCRRYLGGTLPARHSHCPWDPTRPGSPKPCSPGRWAYPWEAPHSLSISCTSPCSRPAPSRESGNAVLRGPHSPRRSELPAPVSFTLHSLASHYPPPQLLTFLALLCVARPTLTPSPG